MIRLYDLSSKHDCVEMSTLKPVLLSDTKDISNKHMKSHIPSRCCMSVLALCLTFEAI
jgi:hypothetical protein